MSEVTAVQTPRETKTRTCMACGEKYEYPVRGVRATRFHCPVCTLMPEPARKAMERLSTRIRKLEKALKKIEEDAAKA